MGQVVPKEGILLHHPGPQLLDLAGLILVLKYIIIIGLYVYFLLFAARYDEFVCAYKYKCSNSGSATVITYAQIDRRNQ